MTDQLSRNFFKNLPCIDSFADTTDFKKYSELPGDWWVVIADVQGSTQAIESGRYKHVNTTGAAAIMAVLNVDRSIEVPYVFGGDGATLAIPPEMVERTKAALLGAQELAKTGFSLDLRVGMVPASFLKAKDKWALVAKIQVSDEHYQTSLSGRGWEYCEELLKDPQTRGQFEVVATESLVPDADFSGFECRWQGIKSRKDHKICIIALALAGNPTHQASTYHAIIKQIHWSTVNPSITTP